MTLERRRIKQLKVEIAALQKERDELQADRNLYRNAFVRHFKWFVKLSSINSNPNLTWLIEDMSKTLNSANKFWW